MNSKIKQQETTLVSFDKDLTKKITYSIEQSDPKFRIKLCALFYQYKLKLKLDQSLHEELLKLKKQHERKTFEIIKQKNEVLNADSQLKMEDYTNYLYLIQQGTDTSRPLPCTVIQEYWHTVLMNCPLLKNIYSRKDGEISKQIVSIDIKRDETKQAKSFTIMINLKQDQKFFTNPYLQVTFYFIDSLNPYRSESNAEFKQKGKKEQAQSGIFIGLLQNINLEEAINKPIERKDMCQRLGKGYEIAQIFKEELVPYSLEYYCDARNPEVKKEMEQKNLIDEMNEKKQKQKTKVMNKEEECEYPEYIEDAECKQQ